MTLDEYEELLKENKEPVKKIKHNDIFLRNWDLNYNTYYPPVLEFPSKIKEIIFQRILNHLNRRDMLSARFWNSYNISEDLQRWLSNTFTSCTVNIDRNNRLEIIFHFLGTNFKIEEQLVLGR